MKITKIFHVSVVSEVVAKDAFVLQILHHL